MRTSIAVPDELFEEAERLAAEFGVSRSELYATALGEYVAKQRASDVTEALNRVYADSAPSATREGFVLMHDTLCHGLVPAESDGGGGVLIYATYAEAAAELRDAIEMRADAMREAGMSEELGPDNRWIAAAVLSGDGRLTLPEVGVEFTPGDLRLVWM